MGDFPSEVHRPTRRARLYTLLLLCGITFQSTANGQTVGSESADASASVKTLQLDLNDLSSGMAAPQDFGEFEFNRTFLRGFQDESGLRNGFRDYGYLGPVDSANEESVEVYKGPASALYGNAKPGGDIDITTKSPGAEPIYGLSLSLDSFGYRRTNIDLGNSLDDASIKYRIIAQTTEGQDYRNYDTKRIGFLAPVLVFKPSGDTTLTFDLEAYQYRQSYDSNFLPIKQTLSFEPGLFLGEPSNLENTLSDTLRLSLDHRLGENSWFRQSIYLQNATDTHNGATYDTYDFPVSQVFDPTDDSVRRINETAATQQKIVVSQTEFDLRLQKWGFLQELQAGVELGVFDYKFNLSTSPIAAISVVNPQYGAFPTRDSTVVGNESYGTHSAVFYASDRITLPYDLKLMFGIRGQLLDDFLEEYRPGGDAGSRRALIFSPRLGLVYSLTAIDSFFASVTHSETPQIGSRSSTGQLFPELIAEQFEFGIQDRRLGPDLTTTASFYKITKTNALTTDPRSPDFQTAGGVRASTGIDLDLDWTMAEHLNLTGGLYIVDARVRSDATLPIGTPLAGVSRDVLSLFLNYDFSSHLSGWSTALGVLSQSAAIAAFPPNAIRLPGYTTTDFTIGYGEKTWSAQLSVSNFMNRRGYNSDGFTVSALTPRLAELWLRFRQ